MRKRLISSLTVIVLLLSLSIPTLAVSQDYTPQAETLKSLGLFLGGDSGFELERTATRTEIAVMMVRILGKETEALNQKLSHPFSDVATWASPYVGYLYQNDITKGVSDTRFGGDDPATVTQYATLVLRALGYNDSSGDFTWDRALTKMRDLGIFSGSQAGTYGDADAALRGYVVNISYLSLFAQPQELDVTLLEKLCRMDGAISSAQIKAAASDVNVSLVANLLGVASPSGSALSAEEIFELASPAVFTLELKLNESDAEPFFGGSGFFISPDGIAITNMHVIYNTRAASAKTPDGKYHKVEGVLAVYPQNDLAMIKIAGSGFPYLSLGDPDVLKSGQKIYCIGSPLGFENTITDGLISNPSRIYDGEQFIQISAPITSGSSGGALLNEYGQVIGVTTASIDNLNFAVPVTLISELYHYSTMRSLSYLAMHYRFGFVPMGPEAAEADLDNDTVPLQSLANDEIVFGSMSNAADVDYYRFEITEPGNILLSLTSDTVHSANLRLEVINPTTKEVLLSSQHYSSVESSCVLGHLFTKGEYYVRVFADATSGNWDNVPYELYCAYKPNRDEYVYDFYEFEDNDSFTMANYLPNDTIYTGTFSSLTDKDYYSFSVDVSGEWMIGAMSSYDLSGVRCEIFDSNRRSIGNGQYLRIEGVADYVIYNATMSPGTYYMVITPKSTATELPGPYFAVAGPIRAS